MPKILRVVAVIVALALATLWFMPAIILPRLAARAAETRGATLLLEGVRPAWPFGVTAQRALIARGAKTVELTQVLARLEDFSGARLEARSGDGNLLLRLPGLTLRDGMLRLQAFPLELLDGFVSGAFTLRGTADGLLRFGANATLEATVREGAAVVRAPIALELPFAQLIIAAGRETDGGWRVDFADLHGPPISGTARGRVSATGELALQVEIAQLEEPARAAFASAGLPTGPLPYSADLGGTLAVPTFSRVRETSQ